MAALMNQGRKQARWGLKWKLVVSMLLVGIVPLVIGLIMAFIQSTKQIREVSGAKFAVLAKEKARSLDLLMRDELEQTARITSDPNIVAALERRRDQDLTEKERTAFIAQKAKAWDAKDAQIVRDVTQGRLADLLHRYYTRTSDNLGQPIPVFKRPTSRALFITDINGALVASINTDASFTNAHEPWWQGAFNNGVGKPYIAKENEVNPGRCCSWGRAIRR